MTANSTSVCTSERTLAAPLRLCWIIKRRNPARERSFGNRRLVPVVLPHGAHVEEAAEASREQWWAEAISLQAQGDDGRMPRRLISAQKVIAEQHRSTDEALEDLVLSLPEGAPLTMAEVHDRIDSRMKAAVTDHRLGRALTANGWKKQGRARRWKNTPPVDPARPRRDRRPRRFNLRIA